MTLFDCAGHISHWEPQFKGSWLVHRGRGCSAALPAVRCQWQCWHQRPRKRELEPQAAPSIARNWRADLGGSLQRYQSDSSSILPKSDTTQHVCTYYCNCIALVVVTTHILIMSSEQCIRIYIPPLPPRPPPAALNAPGGGAGELRRRLSVRCWHQYRPCGGDRAVQRIGRGPGVGAERHGAQRAAL